MWKINGVKGIMNESLTCCSNRILRVMAELKFGTPVGVQVRCRRTRLVTARYNPANTLPSFIAASTGR